MTDQEIRQVIAEKVMGWERVAPWERTAPLVRSRWYKAWASDRAAYRSYSVGAGFWDPLRDISAAWEVRDRLAASGTVLRISGGPDGSEFANFCETITCADGHVAARSVADTAARAICLCALRACGVDPDSKDDALQNENGATHG